MKRVPQAEIAVAVVVWLFTVAVAITVDVLVADVAASIADVGDVSDSDHVSVTNVRLLLLGCEIRRCC